MAHYDHTTNNTSSIFFSCVNTEYRDNFCLCMNIDLKPVFNWHYSPVDLPNFVWKLHNYDSDCVWKHMHRYSYTNLVYFFSSFSKFRLKNKCPPN